MSLSQSDAPPLHNNSGLNVTLIGALKLRVTIAALLAIILLLCGSFGMVKQRFFHHQMRTAGILCTIPARIICAIEQIAKEAEKRILALDGTTAL